MRIIVNKAFNLNLKILRIFGFYPSRTYEKLYAAYAYVAYALFIVPIPILSGIHLLLQEDVDLVKISDNAFIIIEAVCFIFKFSPFIRNKDKIRRCLFMLECQIFTVYTKKQEDIIEECIRICKRNSQFFFIFYATTFASWATGPLFGNQHKFNLEIWLPFNPTSGLKIYSIVFLYVTAGVGWGAIPNSAINPLISGLAYCATSQIKVLKDNLQNLADYAEEEIGNSQLNITEKQILKARIIYDKIQLCIEHHNAILKFVKIYEDTYSSPVFTQFLTGSVVICIACLRLSMVEPFSATFLTMILFVFAFLVEIFVFCYYGTTLVEESDSLANAIYMGKWYDYDIKSRKALIILMERSKRPIIVTAGKLLDLSLVTFTTILRRSYSLLAVLKNY